MSTSHTDKAYVLRLQTLLQEAHYLPENKGKQTPVDGVFGPQTGGAIKAALKDFGVKTEAELLVKLEQLSEGKNAGKAAPVAAVGAIPPAAASAALAALPATPVDCPAPPLAAPVAAVSVAPLAAPALQPAPAPFPNPPLVPVYNQQAAAVGAAAPQGVAPAPAAAVADKTVPARVRLIPDGLADQLRAAGENALIQFSTSNSRIAPLKAFQTYSQTLKAEGAAAGGLDISAPASGDMDTATKAVLQALRSSDGAKGSDGKVISGNFYADGKGLAETQKAGGQIRFVEADFQALKAMEVEKQKALGKSVGEAVGKDNTLITGNVQPVDLGARVSIVTSPLPTLNLSIPSGSAILPPVKIR